VVSDSYAQPISELMSNSNQVVKLWLATWVIKRWGGDG